MRKPLFIFICFFVFAAALKAQQVHFSQFYNTPLLLNPALTGNNECYMRVGGNYRDQWRSVSKPYVTYDFFADARIQPFRFKKNWFGVGLQFFGDKAGTSSLGTNDIRTTFAYHRGLLYQNKMVISIGVSMGLVNKKINTSALYFGNQWDGAQFDLTRPSNEIFTGNSAFYFDLNAGLLVTGKFSDAVNMHLGASVDHLTSPKYSFLGSNNRIDRRILAHIGLNAAVTPTTTLMPKIYFSTQDATQEFIFGCNVSYRIRYDPVYVGLWYRWGRDVVPLVGIGIRNFNLMISYDITVSKFTVASKSQGGLEISLIKTFLCDYLKKKPKNSKYKGGKKIKNCPIF